MIIYKHIIDPTSSHYYTSIPEGSEVLSVQAQEEKLCMWIAIYNTNAPIVLRTFLIVMTGEKIDLSLDSVQFIDTVQLASGSLVLHIFEAL